MSKVAIVILADTAGPGDFGRAVNGLMTAKEFKEAGDEVQIIFDGAGTRREQVCPIVRICKR